MNKGITRTAMMREIIIVVARVAASGLKNKPDVPLKALRGTNTMTLAKVAHTIIGAMEDIDK